MSPSSFIIVLLLVLAFAFAVVWIARNGGWQDEGCHGNCAECHKKCEDKSAQK